MVDGAFEQPSEPSADIATIAPEAADDALPAVGKVFEGEKRSLGAIFAASRTPRPSIEARAETSNIESVEPTEFAPVMQKLRASMSRHGRGYEGILVNGQIVALADGRATIRYSHQHEASARMLERNGKRETVQQVLSELLNEPIGLTIEVEPEPPAGEAAPVVHRSLPPRGPASRAPVAPAEPAAAPPPPPLTAEQKKNILDNDPLVKAVVELFNGDIVKAD